MLQLSTCRHTFVGLLFVVSFLLITASCGGEEEADELTAMVSELAADKTIDAGEWEKLVAHMEGNPRVYLKKGLLVDGQVNEAQIRSFIDRKIGKDVRIQKEAEEGEEKALPKFNVYIENSASMDGYVQGYTEFKNTVYRFLSDIKSPLRDITRTLDLYYINSQAFHFPDQVEDFVDKLDPKVFRERGGNRAETDFSNIIDTIFARSDSRTVSILVSDCVFSPGKGKDADNYLVNQSIGIKNAFERQLSRQADLSTLVLRLESQFDGTYYDYLNQRNLISGKSRPYFMWIIGPEDAVGTLVREVDFEKLRGFNQMHLFSSDTREPEFRILLTNRIGTFNLDRTDMLHGLENAKKETKGKNEGLFQFSIAIDLDHYGLDSSYMAAPQNYRLSTENYRIAVQPISFSDKQKNAALEAFSHYMIISTEVLKKEALEIALLKKVPEWVYACHSADDRVQDEAELNKTFGLKHLVEGVYNAYDAAAGDEKEYFKITISIKN